ncbi:mycofactocin-coupled SDR family oxidoreductase [Nocardioides KLBMP 9356]|uniref:Mycofactocin-coupled SDR family oxidoreductase n=1 Tax=Nocardioides potassii TaxID=2911371 RepID=A0ABS9HCW2_9ACTN|nr:mycofactocin-coupled SDR family oxidoreductase [Nocardioides potassii]MCF6378136.1 mycofactocin-coupled SDR family oxidoreductase [Nocardioides potassii]
MTGRLQGKVALISGAGRGQGRSHAVRFAQEGADIIAFDICAPITTAPYDMATSSDLKETARLVEAAGGRVVWSEADVRDLRQVTDLVERGVSEFGRLDVVCANAAYTCFVENTWSITEDQWDELIDVNLSGVWKTVKAAVPAMIAAGNGGSIAITSSSAGTKGMINLGHYSTAKHGLVGLMRTLANELAEHRIRVNTIHPTGVDTKLLDNDHIKSFLAANPSWGDNMQNALPVELLEPVDISNAILFLASDEGRYVTGVPFAVDAGFAIR